MRKFIYTKFLEDRIGADNELKTIIYNRKQLFWIILCLIISISLSAGMLFYAINKTKNINGVNTHDDKQKKEVEVVFYNLEKKELKKIKVIEGGFALPPEQPDVGSGNVFLGWDKDVLGVVGNVKVYPNVKDISKTRNAIFSKVIYVGNGKLFSIPVKLGGMVECSNLKLAAKYDQKNLEYIGQKNNLSGVTVKNNDTNGSIEIVLSEKDNLIESKLLTELTFKAIGKQYSYTEVILKPEKIEKLNKEKIRIGTDATLINGNIYIY